MTPMHAIDWIDASHGRNMASPNNPRKKSWANQRNIPQQRECR